MTHWSLSRLCSSQAVPGGITPPTLHVRKLRLTVKRAKVHITSKKWGRNLHPRAPPGSVCYWGAPCIPEHRAFPTAHPTPPGVIALALPGGLGWAGARAACSLPQRALTEAMAGEGTAQGSPSFLGLQHSATVQPPPEPTQEGPERGRDLPTVTRPPFHGMMPFLSPHPRSLLQIRSSTPLQGLQVS